jgi:hypothetical protein
MTNPLVEHIHAVNCSVESVSEHKAVFVRQQLDSQHVIHTPGGSITKAGRGHPVGQQSIAVNCDSTSAHGYRSKNHEHMPFSEGVPGILSLVVVVEAMDECRPGNAYACPGEDLLVDR